MASDAARSSQNPIESALLYKYFLLFESSVHGKHDFTEDNFVERVKDIAQMHHISLDTLSYMNNKFQSVGCKTKLHMIKMEHTAYTITFHTSGSVTLSLTKCRTDLPSYFNLLNNITIEGVTLCTLSLKGGFELMDARAALPAGLEWEQQKNDHFYCKLRDDLSVVVSKNMNKVDIIARKVQFKHNFVQNFFDTCENIIVKFVDSCDKLVPLARHISVMHPRIRGESDNYLRKFENGRPIFKRWPQPRTVLDFKWVVRAINDWGGMPPPVFTDQFPEIPIDYWNQVAATVRMHNLEPLKDGEEVELTDHEISNMFLEFLTSTGSGRVTNDMMARNVQSDAPPHDSQQYQPRISDQHNVEQLLDQMNQQQMLLYQQRRGTAPDNTQQASENIQAQRQRLLQQLSPRSRQAQQAQQAQLAQLAQRAQRAQQHQQAQLAQQEQVQNRLVDDLVQQFSGSSLNSSQCESDDSHMMHVSGMTSRRNSNKCGSGYSPRRNSKCGSGNGSRQGSFAAENTGEPSRFGPAAARHNSVVGVSGEETNAERPMNIGRRSSMIATYDPTTIGEASMGEQVNAAILVHQWNEEANQ